MSVVVLHKTRSEAEENSSKKWQFIDQDLALLMTRISGEPKYITVAGQVVVKAMRETLFLVLAKESSLTDVVHNDNMGSVHAYMTAKGFMHVIQTVPFKSQLPAWARLTYTFQNIRRSLSLTMS